MVRVGIAFPDGDPEFFQADLPIGDDNRILPMSGGGDWYFGYGSFERKLYPCIIKKERRGKGNEIDFGADVDDEYWSTDIFGVAISYDAVVTLWDVNNEETVGKIISVIPLPPS